VQSRRASRATKNNSRESNATVARTLHQKEVPAAIGGENLLRDCAEHYHDQTGGRELRLDAKDYSETSDKVSHAEKNREAFAHFNVRG
jgi:hypothetical protein